MIIRHFEHYIDGRFSRGQRQFESINPATNTPWALMPMAMVDDVDAAVKAARRAFYAPAWADMTATQRGRLLYKLADLITEHADELAASETTDTGKIIRETYGQIAYVADYYRYYAGLADKIQGAQLPIDKPDMEVWLRREPIGVVAAIVPWNSQLFLAAVKLGPALATGCTMVLKASELGPAPLLMMAKLIDQAGIPPGVVNIITGDAENCGIPLTTHPLVERISFTGGADTARHIVRNSAANLAQVSLELGGKSPVVVFADVDVESVANAVIAGVFAACGQSCVAGSRLIVHHAIKDKLLAVLVKKAAAIRIGDPHDMATEMGPLASLAQLERIEATVAESTAMGADLICGGRRVTGFAGYYYQPTILDCSSVRAPCVDIELFGPVLSVLSFTDEKEALAMANDTPYGLASGVFTQNISRAHRLCRKIRAGIVWINTYRAISPLVPFGGYGRSGLGREGGIEAALEYTRTKSVWLRTTDDPIPDPFVMR